MMKDFYIYLSGGMSGLTVEQQKKWRTQVRKAIEQRLYDTGKIMNPVFWSPPEYYPFIKDINESYRKSEREVMEFDLNQVRKADLIIVNFNSPGSIGTAMELAVAREYRIPIIGLNKDHNELHSWLTESCTRMCDDMYELVDHICNFYLL